MERTVQDMSDWKHRFCDPLGWANFFNSILDVIADGPAFGSPGPGGLPIEHKHPYVCMRMGGDPPTTGFGFGRTGENPLRMSHSEECASPAFQFTMCTSY